jgi:hypothetical protein
MFFMASSSGPYKRRTLAVASAQLPSSQMTLAEMKQLQALLEKAREHNILQMAYIPTPSTSYDAWRYFDLQCSETLNALSDVIFMIEEAMNDEQ